MEVAATSVGEIGLDLVVNKSGFEKSMNSMQKTAEKSMSGITSAAKKMAAALAAAFSVAKIIEFGKECLELGSDLAEVQNVVDVTFSTMSESVNEWAKAAADAYGLSETMAKQYVGTFGSMAEAFGFTEAQAYEMSTALTGLVGDVASFYNLDQDEAYTKLKSVFTGETESLKDLGVVMTQSALDAYALANGYGKTTSAMTEAEKVSLRLAFVTDQLSNAAGDFARTEDSWANQTRILSLRFDSLKATLGQGLINVFTPVLKVLNSLIAKLQTAAEAFTAFTELVFGHSESGSSSTTDAISSATEATDALTDSAEAAAEAAEEAQKSLMGFDEINKLDDTSSDSTSDSTSDSSSSGASTSVSVDTSSLEDSETVIDQVDEKLTKLLNDIKTLCAPATASLQNLWNNGLAKLGNFSSTALTNFYNNFLVPVGTWVMGEGIPRFVDALDNGLSNIDYDKISNALNRLWNALAPFAVNVGEGLLWFWENVLVPLGTWVANEVVPRFLDTLSTVIETLNGVLDKLKPLFQWFWDEVLEPIAEWTGDLFLAAWDSINAALEDFSDWMIEHTPTIDELSQAFEDLKGWIEDNSTALEIATIFLAGFTTAIIAYTVASNASSIASALETAAITAYCVATGVATTATSLFSAAMSFLTSPITLVIMAITAAIAVGVLIYKNWDTIKEKAIEIWGAIRDWFEKTINKICEFFTNLWSGIKETFASVANWFKEKFQAAWDGIKNVFGSVKTWFTDNVWGKIKNVFSNVKTWFSDIFTGAWTKIKDAFGSVKTWFTDNVWEKIKNVFGSVKTWFSDIFTGAWEKIKDAFSGVSSFFTGIWEDITGIFSDVGSAIAEAVEGTVKKAINTVLSTAVSIINGFISAINTAISLINAIPGVNIEKLEKLEVPQLAQGGFVEKNTPQLALIGDNRHQGEVVAPEDKLAELAKQGAELAGAGSGNGEVIALLKKILKILEEFDFDIYMDGESVKKKIVKRINANTKATGVCEIIV